MNISLLSAIPLIFIVVFEDAFRDFKLFSVTSHLPWGVDVDVLFCIIR